MNPYTLHSKPYTNEAIQKLRDLPIEGVAERLGLKVTHHKTLCPFHNDNHPSLSIHVRRNSYKCFVCGAHGGVIDLAMHVLGKNFIDTCDWLAEEHGAGRREYGVGSRVLNPPPSPINPNPSALIPPPPRFLFPRGSRISIYNLPILKLLKPGEELWIAEGCSDCWALLSSGRKAIAIPSATLLKEEDLKPLITLIHNSKFKIHNPPPLTLHMSPDADIPGEKLYLQLKQLFPQLVRHPLPEGIKDYSEYYVKSLIPQL